MLPEKIEILVKKLRYKATDEVYEKSLNSFLKEAEKYKKQRSTSDKTNIWKIFLWSKAGYLAASFLVVVSFIISFVLYGKVVDLRNELNLARQDSATTLIDDSVTINFYLKEHQDTIARYASNDSAASQPFRMQINQEDLMYYELFGNKSELLSPGVIFRGPSFQRQISSPGTPVISNGHTLTLSEARDATNFDFISPSWFHPYYKLGQIRIIEGRDALQLLYTNGINSISLFEQSLDGQRGLSHNDFREYAVYNNQGEGGGTILAWRDNTLSYVLIGNIELSKLMDMAQLISVIK